MWRQLVLSVAVWAWIAPIVQGDVWHVDAEVTVAGDGRSWVSAVRHLQDVLTHEELAAGDQIWVAAGAYYPDRDASSPEGTDNPLATFELVSGVQIYGGFPPGGGDGTFEARDLAAYPTVLSGQVFEPDHDPFPVCHDPPQGAGGCYVETPGLTGCLVPYCCMIVCDQDSYCCVVEWDALCVGIAWDICPSYLATHVVRAHSVGPTTRLDGFIITAGAAHGPPHSTGEVGGGMLLYYDASPIISNCTFVSNTAEKGGAVGVRKRCEPVLINCTFVANEAALGGAVHVLSGHVTLANCLFSGNAAHDGIGTALYAESWSEVGLFNCTLADNFSVEDGIAVHGADEIINCILWDNGATPVSGAGSVHNTCIEGGHDGEGNIDVPPLFADPDHNDYRLAHDSPCIDRGSNEAIVPDHADLDGDLDTVEPTPLDLDLKGRVLGALVDMGAYEFCLHDLDSDGSVGSGDFLALLSAWGTNPGHPADFDDSGEVGATDFLALLAHWGSCL